MAGLGNNSSLSSLARVDVQIAVAVGAPFTSQLASLLPEWLNHFIGTLLSFG